MNKVLTYLVIGECHGFKRDDHKHYFEEVRSNKIV